MILPDDTPDSPKRQNEAPLQPSQPSLGDSTSQMPPPPAYPGYSSYQQETQLIQDTNHAPTIPARGEPAGKRFIMALACAGLVYLLLGALTSSIVDLARGHATAGPIGKTWPKASDGKIIGCTKGAADWHHYDHDHRPTVSFELPGDLNTFYMFKRGGLSAGNVAIIQDDRMHNTNSIHVDVVAEHSTPHWLHVTYICVLERSPGEQGIGIFIPESWWSTGSLPDLDMGVTVRLPKSTGDKPITIKRFETSLDRFSHHIGNLGKSVIFESLSLQGSNSVISSQSLYAKQLTLKTSNADITGGYEVADSLSLTTSNGRIAVNATLHHDDDKQEPSTVVLNSSNGPIDSSLYLVSDTSDATGGSFKVTARSSNDRLTLAFPVAPVDSELHLDATTSNSPASVYLHPTYEGVFNVKTTNSYSSVLQNKSEDPSGRGRERAFHLTRNGATMKGVASWGGRHLGDVQVRTTNAAVSLLV